MPPPARWVLIDLVLGAGVAMVAGITLFVGKQTIAVTSWQTEA